MCEPVVGFRPLSELADTNPETLPANTPSHFRFRYIDLSSVDRGFINWASVSETMFGLAPSRARRPVKPTDVLYGTVRPNLQSHGYIEPGWTGPLVASTGFSVVRARQGIGHPGYLFHSVMSSAVTAQAVRNAVGSSYPALNDSDVRRFLIFAAPYREQEKIAEILDTLDTAIRETVVIIAKLKLVKRGLLHDLLTRGIDNNGELRPPPSEAPDLYIQSSLGWMPKEWEVVRLESVLSELGQGWSPDCPAESADANEWGILKTTSIVWDGYNENENKRLPISLKPRPALEVASGDILITRAGPMNRVGVVAHVFGTRKKLMISDKMYRLRLLKSEVSAYFALALASTYAQDAISRTISGMAESQTNISQSVIRNLAIFRPKATEQGEIVERVRILDERLAGEALSLHKLQKQKSGLVDDLLLGRVRVTPLFPQTQ